MCNGSTNGGMVCSSNPTMEFTYTRFNINDTYPNLWLGWKQYNGPDTTYKDVRYYLNQCLESSEMAKIKAALTCKEFCQTCSDPETCTT